MSTTNDLLLKLNPNGASMASTEPRTPTISIDSPAFRGIAGEIVRHVDEYIEASPINSLTQFLTLFAASVGNRPHFYVHADRHSATIFNCIVGRTAKARKGSANSAILTYFENDYGLPFNSINGIGSGEGIIDLIKDPDPDDLEQKNRLRLPVLIDEGELSQLMKVMQRQGATLEANVLKLWDGKPIGNITRGRPFKASNYHVCINGHIQIETLKRELKPSYMRSGFANRFLFIYADRDKRISIPRQYLPVTDLKNRLQRAIELARDNERLNLSAEAVSYWDEIYDDLSADRIGIVGDITSRNEPYTLRLALIYALLDESPCIEPEHIESALAVIKYSELTVDYLYGGVDPELEDLKFFIKSNGGSATQTQISYEFYKRNKNAAELREIRERGVAEGAIYVQTNNATGGAPSHIWVNV